MLLAKNTGTWTWSLLCELRCFEKSFIAIYISYNYYQDYLSLFIFYIYFRKNMSIYLFNYCVYSYLDYPTCIQQVTNKY